MPPEEEKENIPPITPEPLLRKSHTYEDDVEKAMNVTDATVVQELLIAARARELAEKDYKKSSKQKKWYSLFAFVFIISALIAFGYGVYHYYRLTVPVEQRFSVGVFPNTPPIVVEETDIRQTINSFSLDSTFEKNKPFLVSLVSDRTTLSPISKESFFNFIEARATEPFVASMDIVRLGIMNDGIQNNFFIILSIPDPEITSKEFLIAESSLLQLFYKALNIDISGYTTEIGRLFESGHMFNLPVRTLSATPEENEAKQPILLYSYLTNNIIIVTTKPQVLKVVYDAIIQQQFFY